jgi:membrane protein YdbS with pleckstrin-like domain
MGYVDDHLLANERVVYRARLHWVIYATAIWTALLAIGIGVLLYLFALQRYPDIWWIPGLALLGLALLLAIGPWIRRKSSEFAVTNKRVLIKLGVVQRDSLETLLSKIEAIGVDQSLMGRMLDFGTITVIGTGGTRESFDRIGAPLEFRRQVQSQVVALDEGRGGAPAIAAAPRDERECPWCAEPILAKARVCKHCGREVAPSPS